MASPTLDRRTIRSFSALVLALQSADHRRRQHHGTGQGDTNWTSSTPPGQERDSSRDAWPSAGVSRWAEPQRVAGWQHASARRSQLRFFKSTSSHGGERGLIPRVARRPPQWYGFVLVNALILFQCTDLILNIFVWHRVHKLYCSLLVCNSDLHGLNSELPFWSSCVMGHEIHLRSCGLRMYNYLQWYV